jgi:iron complex outermembrane recepter protein
LNFVFTFVSLFIIGLNKNKNSKMKSWIITICIVGITQMAALGQSGQIKGIVADQNGKPAPFVSVQLKEIKKNTSSDENGVFSLINIKPDVYTLIASFVGYKTLEQKIKIEDGKTLNLSLELFENAETLKEIIVKGYLSQNEKMVSVGKIAIRPMDLPQSVMTIDKQVIENQQVRSMSDVLMNTNGVYIMGTTGGYQEEIAGRGFSFGSTNTFKNGVRYFNGMMSEMNSIERVEVMKGSTAILFGNVAAGGIINLVTKKPKFDFGGEVSLRTGSFGLIKPSFDIFGGISKNMAFRLNGSYEKANSFRAGVSSERFYVNPSLLFKIGQKTDLLIETDYMQDRRTPDFGAGIINYQLVEIPRERFLGVSWSNYEAKQASATATLTHRLSDHWKLNLTTAFRHYANDLFANTRPNAGVGLIKSDGTWIRNIQRSKSNDNYYLAQLDLTGAFNTGSISHQMLAGIDTDQFETYTTTYTPLVRYDTVNVFGTKNHKIRTDVPNLEEATLTTSPVNRVGIYLQDLMALSQKFKLLAGLRYSYQQTGSDVYTYTNKTTDKVINYDGAFSPRFGLIFQPTKNHSLFASYSNSFVLNTGVDIKGNALKPSLVDQYEVGIKNELLNGKLSVNLTVYEIVNGNFAQTALANGNTYTYIKELVGTVSSEGIEIDLAARPVKGLDLMAGYSFNETKYVKSNTYVEGSLLKYNPNHTANMSINYRLEEGKLKGLTLGLTGVFIGDRQAGRSTRIQVANDAYKLVEIPSYTQIDGTIRYNFGIISVAGKIGNIFDTISYNVHDDNSVNPITPRNYSFSIGIKL